MSAPSLHLFDDPGERDEHGRTVLTALPPDVVAANRAAWVAALRSGEYAQATGELRTGDGTTRTSGGFCCLGVAEDVARRGRGWTHVTVDAGDDTDEEPGWGVPGERLLVRFTSPVRFAGGLHDEVRLGVGERRETKTLTARTCRWLGLWQANPAVAWRSPASGRWEVTTLVALNDDEELPLTDVAAVVADQPADWTGVALTVLDDVTRRRRDVGDVDDDWDEPSPVTS